VEFANGLSIGQFLASTSSGLQPNQVYFNDIWSCREYLQSMTVVVLVSPNKAKNCTLDGSRSVEYLSEKKEPE
jgi:hypothetical protein